MAVIHPLFARPQAPAESNDFDGDSLVHFPALGSDWSNQELADLFRVKQLLERAGVVLSVDRGITDENDPWFVFCNADDDVFVHICRMGRQYLLDSPSLGAPLTGPSFDALIQMFVQRADTPPVASNVVPLRPRNGLYMHPAIMLTALIWSIYIAADDLVGLAQAKELHDNHIPPGALDLDALHESPTVDEALRLLHQLETEIAAEVRPTMTPMGESQVVRSADTSGHHPGGPHGMAMAASAVAVSIAVVALSQGLLTVAPEPEPSAGPLPLGTLPELVLVETSAPVVSTAAGTPLIEPAAPPQLEFAADAPTEPASIAMAAVVQVVANLRLPKIATKIAQDDHDLVLAAAMGDAAPPPLLTIAEGSASDGGTMAAMAAASEATEAAVTNFDLASRLADLKDQLGFIGGDLDMLASADQPLIVDSEGGDDIGPGGGAAPSLAAFTPEAQAYVGFLMSKRKSVEIVTLAREILVIDTSARDSYDDVSFTLSWSFEDGSIISTIGHMRDFIDFGLA